jgi:hypothetical protein
VTNKKILEIIKQVKIKYSYFWHCDIFMHTKKINDGLMTYQISLL